MLTLSSITKVVTSKAFVVGASIATGLFVVGAVIKHRRKSAASIEPKTSKTKDEIIQEAARVLETNSEKPKISSEVLKEANFVDVGLNKEAEALNKIKSMSDGEVLEVDEAVKIIADLTSDKDIAEIMKAINNGDVEGAANKAIEVGSKISKKIEDARSENKSGTCSAASGDNEPFNQIRFKSKRVK